ncbi:hypothetical protein ASU31_25065 [Pedobacter ginsenosidimutans]|uniref:Uncharacterized protein n=1 Tax=Pedobacter ginsenosidimutans TaxID=687842 RepID=A0A0T5VHP8_9SPHI|nr:hypothetical protein ASU31_25065 [Pedobacter ginsenosidimutans]
MKTRSITILILILVKKFQQPLDLKSDSASCFFTVYSGLKYIIFSYDVGVKLKTMEIMKIQMSQSHTWAG